MKIISHNTFSYLSVRKKWMKPFSFIAKCQSLLLGKQLDIVSGVDVRVRFDKQGKPIIAHGLIEYEGNIYACLAGIDCLCGGKPFYARVMLETTPFMSKQDRMKQEIHFINFCNNLLIGFRNITFYGGWARDRWRQKIYDFRTTEPQVTEMHGSVSGNKLNCLRLKSWAKRNNHNTVSSSKTEYVMIDYIEYR